MQLQACDLVPIVEPEILIDGDYDIHRSSAVSQEVLQVSYIIARLLPTLKCNSRRQILSVSALWAQDL